MKRRRYPLKLAYAITINKSQGQTLKKVGLLYLKTSVFTHGQLYVALTRVQSQANKFVLTDQRTVNNIVYNEVLLKIERYQAKMAWDPLDFLPTK
jgi:ATP-dependent DNA helicase PIF1